VNFHTVELGRGDHPTFERKLRPVDFPPQQRLELTSSRSPIYTLKLLRCSNSLCEPALDLLTTRYVIFEMLSISKQIMAPQSFQSLGRYARAMPWETRRSLSFNQNLFSQCHRKEREVQGKWRVNHILGSS